MATIRDVAKAAGVSTATVSAVMNDSAYVSPELRSRVQTAIEELDYAPSTVARNLKRGKSQLIAVSVADLSNPFFSHIVCLAEAAAAAWGYSLVVFNSDEKTEAEKRILTRIRALSCDGILLVPVGEAAQHLQRDLAGRTIPTVMFGRTVDDRRSDTVTIDNESAGRQATNYLLDLGHRRIAFVAGRRDLSTVRERLAGYEAALCERGITPDPGLVCHVEIEPEAATRATSQLLAGHDRPTAVFTYNDLMAVGALVAIRASDLRVPDDVSLVGHDDILYAPYLQVPLTTVAQPTRELAETAARLLIERLRGDDAPPRRVVLQPRLVVRASTAAPPSRAGREVPP